MAIDHGSKEREMRWYVSRAGVTEGPFEEEALREAARANKLDRCQVRDEAGGQWLAAEKSPFGALMKDRGLVGPIVAGIVVAIAGGLILGVLGAVGGGLATFGLLAAVRKFG